MCSSGIRRTSWCSMCCRNWSEDGEDGEDGEEGEEGEDGEEGGDGEDASYRLRRSSSCSHSGPVSMSRSRASMRRYAVSASEPSAMSRNRRYSLLPRFAAPSAILVGAELAARRICAIR